MIVGERVTLRPLAPEDVEPLNAIITEPEGRRWWGTDPTVDDQDAFTIVVGGEIVGWLGWYEETDPDYCHGGLDIFLAPRLHGQGLGREALLAAAERDAAAHGERLRAEAEDELEAYIARRRREADRLAEAARKERYR